MIDQKQLFVPSKRIVALTTASAATMLALVLTASLPATAPAAEASENKFPSFVTVKKLVEKTLSSDRHYRSGDLLSQSQTAGVLAQLKSSGWEVTQSRELLARVPSDEEFLVRELRTPKGLVMMRQIAGLKDGFDRIDRLSRIPNGPQLIAQLIEGPDGYKLIAYLTETRGGKELGQMLDRTPSEGNFNEPTGRIYTEKQLLAELQRLHTAEKKKSSD